MQGESALWLACSACDEKMVKFLLRCGARANDAQVAITLHQNTELHVLQVKEVTMCVICTQRSHPCLLPHALTLSCCPEWC